MAVLSSRRLHAAPLVLDDERHVTWVAAEVVANRMIGRPRLRMMLPTGHTPRGMYALMRRRAAAGTLPAGGTELVQLDEYLGAAPEQRFSTELRRQLDGVDFAATHWIDAAADDPEAEAARHAAEIARAPIDLAVLGVGRDGHLAFNEPGSTLADATRVVTLTETTRQDNADAFDSPDAVPDRAITTGLRELAYARELVIMATGEAKADVVAKMLRGPMTPACPASLLRDHRSLLVLVDRAAGARVT